MCKYRCILPFFLLVEGTRLAANCPGIPTVLDSLPSTLCVSSSCNLHTSFHDVLWVMTACKVTQPYVDYHRSPYVDVTFSSFSPPVLQSMIP